MVRVPPRDSSTLGTINLVTMFLFVLQIITGEGTSSPIDISNNNGTSIVYTIPAPGLNDKSVTHDNDTVMMGNSNRGKHFCNIHVMCSNGTH